MRIFLFIAILFPLFAFGQSFGVTILSDTTLAIGDITEDDTYAGRVVSEYCDVGMDVRLKKGELILISGIYTCIMPYDKHEKPFRFYEIIYNKKFFFIETSKVGCDVSYYNQINMMSDSVKTNFRRFAKLGDLILYDKKLEKAQKFIAKCKPSGLTVLDWNLYDESEYTDGTGIKITVHNPTSKIIKYLWFSFIGYNPVNDVIPDRAKGTQSVTIKGVGPINPDESGSYDYNYVWFTDLVKTAKISQIKVQYMDGSFKIITNPKEITMDKDSYELIKKL